MHDLEKFWEILQEIPPNTSVQDLGIHLSEFLPENEGAEASAQSTEQNKDQE